MFDFGRYVCDVQYSLQRAHGVFILLSIRSNARSLSICVKDGAVYSMLPTCSGSEGSSFRRSCIASTSSWTRSMDLKYLTVLTLSSG